MAKDLTMRLNGGNDKATSLSGPELTFLSKYVPSSLMAGADCEYCGNGCGTSNCASCCSSTDDYLPLQQVA